MGHHLHHHHHLHHLHHLHHHHNSSHHIGLFHAHVGGSILDGRNDHITHVGIATVGAQHTNALDAFGAAVVGDAQISLLLNHAFTSASLVSTWGLWLSTSAMVQRLCRLIGRVSVIRTRSPTRQELSSS